VGRMEPGKRADFMALVNSCPADGRLMPSSKQMGMRSTNCGMGTSSPTKETGQIHRDMANWFQDQSQVRLQLLRMEILLIFSQVASPISLIYSSFPPSLRSSWPCGTSSIKSGERLFYPYCDFKQSAAKRKAELCITLCHRTMHLRSLRQCHRGGRRAP
jgi:hypothetical protein